MAGHALRVFETDVGVRLGGFVEKTVTGTASCYSAFLEVWMARVMPRPALKQQGRRPLTQYVKKSKDQPPSQAGSSPVTPNLGGGDERA